MNVRLAVRWLETTLLGSAPPDTRPTLECWVAGDDEAMAEHVAERETARQDAVLEHILLAGGEIA